MIKKHHHSLQFTAGRSTLRGSTNPACTRKLFGRSKIVPYTFHLPREGVAACAAAGGFSAILD
jgi:hypothetical protein